MDKIQYSVVVPAHNEAENMKKLVLKLKKSLSKLKKRFEIIIVNDNSTDNSLQVLKELKKKTSQLVIINRTAHPGVGNAIKEGLCKTRGRIIITMDGDLSHNPEEMPALIKKLNGYEMVCGSRYIRGSKANIELSRKIISKIFNIIFGNLLRMPVRDFTSGFRVYKREVIEKINLKNENFGIYIEIPIKACLNGFKLTEAPITYSKRQSGRTNLNYFVQGPEYLKVIFEVLKVKLRSYFML